MGRPLALPPPILFNFGKLGSHHTLTPLLRHVQNSLLCDSYCWYAGGWSAIDKPSHFPLQSGCVVSEEWASFWPSVTGSSCGWGRSDSSNVWVQLYLYPWKFSLVTRHECAYVLEPKACLLTSLVSVCLNDLSNLSSYNSVAFRVCQTLIRQFFQVWQMYCGVHGWIVCCRILICRINKRKTQTQTDTQTELN